MKTYKSFPAWASAQKTSHKKLISALRKLVKKAAPSLTEGSKWGNGVWIGKKWPVLFLYAGSDHIQFGFFGGSSLSDPKKLLQGKAMHVRHIKVHSIGDIHAAAFTRFIKQAVRNEGKERK